MILLDTKLFVEQCGYTGSIEYINMLRMDFKTNPNIFPKYMQC